MDISFMYEAELRAEIRALRGAVRALDSLVHGQGGRDRFTGEEWAAFERAMNEDALAG